MAQFNGMQLTNAGRDVLAKAITGKTLKFTRGLAGTGYLPEGQEVGELENLIAPYRDMEIAAIDMTGHTGTAKITLILSNKELLTGFFLREIGLFAEDPDTGQEILYGYSNSGNTADFMPAQDGPDAVYYRFNITVIVDQAKNVTAIFSDNPLAVTHSEMDSRLDTVILAMKARDDFLQKQIDMLAHASIMNSLEHINNFQEV
ncbi:MAG: hypothetical protein IJQ56_08155 [Synergistaceae bacterium]|nr:hypothetical protein [Synergistaceae bacterium]